MRRSTTCFGPRARWSIVNGPAGLTTKEIRRFGPSGRRRLVGRGCQCRSRTQSTGENIYDCERPTVRYARVRHRRTSPCPCLPCAGRRCSTQKSIPRGPMRGRSFTVAVSVIAPRIGAGKIILHRSCPVLPTFWTTGIWLSLITETNSDWPRNGPCSPTMSKSLVGRMWDGPRGFTSLSALISE